MRIRRWATALGFSTAILTAGGCESSTEPPGRYDRDLGDAGDGLPTMANMTDVGILRDQKTYKAADIKGRIDAGTTVGQVRELVEDLVTAYAQGDVIALLEKFNPADIALLQDSPETLDVLYSTLEDSRAFLEKSISAKLGPEVVAQVYERELLSFRDDLIIDIRGADSATVKPSTPVRRLLGPAASDVIAVERTGGLWLIHLEAPLSEDDLTAISEYHERVQTAVQELIDMIDDDTITTADQIQQAREMALAGETPVLDDADEDAPDPTDDDPVEP